MNPWIVVAVMIAAGAMMSFQAPINANLSQAVGLVEAAFMSFCVGTVILIAAVLFAGKGSLAGLRQVPWWQYLGGLIGAIFVTTTLWSAPRIGVTAMVIAALAGQMAAALVIDQFGWMGIPRRPIELHRVLGIVLLVVSVVLINWRKGV